MPDRIRAIDFNSLRRDIYIFQRENRYDPDYSVLNAKTATASLLGFNDLDNKWQRCMVYSRGGGTLSVFTCPVRLYTAEVNLVKANVESKHFPSMPYSISQDRAIDSIFDIDIFDSSDEAAWDMVSGCAKVVGKMPKFRSYVTFFLDIKYRAIRPQ